jgi:exopolysaccharide production protein ExoQ
MAMNRPLKLRSERAREPARVPVQSRWVPDGRGSLITSWMVGILIAYLAIPLRYWHGETNLMSDVDMSAGDPLARAIKLGLLTVSSVIVLWRARLAWPFLRFINPFFLVFMALVPLSVLWSIERSVTAARYVSIIAIVQVCFAFTLIGWHRARFQNVVRPVLTVLLVASVVVGLFYPDLAIEAGESSELKSAWRGLLSQKNQFGMLAGFGVIFWLHAWFNKEARWWVALPFVGLSWTCVLLSRSSTSLLSSMLSTLFMAMVMVIPANLRRFMPYIVSSFAALVVVYALAVLNLIPGIGILLEPIAAMSGKDLTFSNRAQIWQIIKDHIQLAPLLGSGYGAYWVGALPSSPSYVFLGRMYFYPSQSHNGYLEIVNDLGFAGLICLLGYLVFWVRQSLQLMKFDRGQGMLFLALFFQQAIANLSESTWLAVTSGFAFVIVTLATLALARSLLEQRLRRYFGHFRTGTGRSPG